MKKLINTILDTFYPLFSPFMPPKTFRYAACGGGNLVLDIILYYLVFHFVLHKQDVHLFLFTISSPIAAFLIVFPITFFTGFWLNRHITFHESTLRGRTQLSRYFLVVMGAFLLNYVLMKFFIEVLNFYPTIAKITTTAVSVVYSYILQNRFTFKTHK